jgi:hypothetical protein
MKVKKLIKKFRKLDKKLRDFGNAVSHAMSPSQEEVISFEQEEGFLRKRRQKTLNKIFHYALAH